MFKCKYFNQSDPPRMAANFRHLLSCGTIGLMLTKYYALINCAQGPYKEIFVLTFKVHVSKIQSKTQIT